MKNIVYFKKAEPVFIADENGVSREQEMNVSVGFFTHVEKRANTLLRIAGSSTYTVLVNGQFVHCGPARSAHDFYRMDVISLDKWLHDGDNVIAIKLSSYNCYSTAYICVPGFLCAEVECAGEIVAYTAVNGNIPALVLDERIQKVFRNRNYTEAYRLDSRSAKFALHPEDCGFEKGRLIRTEDKCFIEREAYYPDFKPEYPVCPMGGGVITLKKDFDYKLTRCHVDHTDFSSYSEEEMEYRVTDEIKAHEYENTSREGGVLDVIHVPDSTFRDFAFSNELTGFIEFNVHAEEDSALYVMYDEVYNNSVNPVRNYAMTNCITLFLKAGDYRFNSVEPNSMKYVRLSCMKGDVTVDDFRLRLACYPEIKKRPDIDDPDLIKIYDAAVETFRQNAYDIYMDCPSRERGGWLCDSFFTSRVEHELAGKSDVERVFLSNFLITDWEPCPGMLPMVYPSDRNDGQFIPNWAMWFVLELEEFEARTGDREFIEFAHKKVAALINYFKKFENEDGLLEKLDSWVFVEWSHANDLVQDVNYPTNMLYARMKRAYAKLYGGDYLIREAEKIEEYIRRNTIVNGFFCDNSVRGEDGVLNLSGECTEACQYYAFFMNIATPETHPTLWKCLLEEFGPERKNNNKHPEIAFANAFIGNYLRLDLLYRYGEFDRLEEEIKGYFLYMAEETGTLWENTDDSASCNHGFASHAAIWINRIAEAKKAAKK